MLLGFLGQIKHEFAFGNTKECTESTSLILTNLGGKIECFDKATLHTEVMFVLGVTIEAQGESLKTSLRIKIGPNQRPTVSTVVKQPDICFISVMVFDPKVNQFDRFLVHLSDSSIQKIRIRVKYDELRTGGTTHSVCFIDADGDFSLITFDLSKIKSEVSINKLESLLKPVALCIKSELKLPCLNRNSFTCLDLLESEAQGSDCLKVVLGSQNGIVFFYIYANKAFHLIKTFNHGANFYTSDITFQIRSVQSSLTIAKQSSDNGGNDDSAFRPHFFALTTMDGILKIFLESEPSAVYELQMQNKPLRSLFWDPNISLMFFIDENDLSLLTALSFSNPVEPTALENVRKNIKLGLKVEKIDYSPVTEKLVSITSDNIISIGSLPVGLLGIARDCLQIQTDKLFSQFLYGGRIHKR